MEMVRIRGLQGRGCLEQGVTVFLTHHDSPQRTSGAEGKSDSGNTAGLQGFGTDVAVPCLKI